MRHHEGQPTSEGRPGMKGLPPEQLQAVAAYFQTLSEPTRLQILNHLRDGERNVGELAELCGYSAANVSRHLTMLTAHGMVARETRGTSVYYRIADEGLYALCDLVCSSIARQLEHTARDRKAFARVTARAGKQK